MALAPASLASQRPTRGFVIPGLAVAARRDLAFGEIFRGMPTSVVPTDVNSAEFEITVPDPAQLQITLLLPGSLRSVDGDVLPLVFGWGDGFAVREGTNPTSFPFNPTQPLVTVLDETQRLLIQLGGTVLPSRTQRLAQYDATLTVIVADLGI